MIMWNSSIKYFLLIFCNLWILQSPIRVQVIKRKCDIEFRGQGKDANSRGQCVCSMGTVDFLGRCNNAAIFFVVIAALFLLFAAAIGGCYIDHKKKQSDQLWHVNVEELHFSEPVEIIGQGSFGVVLMAGKLFTRINLCMFKDDTFTYKKLYRGY